MKCSYLRLLVGAPLLLLPFAAAQCPTLLWSDEFDGDALDETKWSYVAGDGCDQGEALCGWGQDQWQWYTADGSNLEVSDGTLKISAKYDPSTEEYTSARITSLGRADFDMTMSLRFEASMKVPTDSIGLWPAFWMWPSLTERKDWPRGGEIDIMDFIGREPNQTYGGAHYGEAPGDKSQKAALLNYQEHAGVYFHQFVLEKTPLALTWFVDGHEIFSLTPEDIEPKFEWPFENVFHLILNMAVGGNWPEYPDSTTVFPATFEIDYIRVYDLSTTTVPTPRIVGPTLVNRDTDNVEYCIDVGSLQPDTDFDSFIEWYVPEGSEHAVTYDKPNCINVNFGTQSGYVETSVYFNCGTEYIFWLPIEVQDYYGISYKFWAGGSQAQFVASTGTYSESRNGDKPEAPAIITYQRSQAEIYDYILFSTDSVKNPHRYVNGARKLYMDALSETAAPCTRFWIELQDSSTATPENYPAGRHSRYLAFLGKDGVDYQTLEFDFYDTPDTTVTKVDQIAILVDSFVQRSDTYYLKDFVQTSAGCTEKCMPLSTNTCQIAAKSEAGMCTDGFNNDEFGWNGDTTTDCLDSDCYLLDPACLATTPAPTPPKEAVEICDDGIDNDHNGFTDCDDLACADSPLCGSWWNPACSKYDGCVNLGLVGECCPTPHGEYLDCCGAIETPASCSVHPRCHELGLTGECCPSVGEVLDCCQPELCTSNPRCSGLDGACCPTTDGAFLECCENRPETCQIHQKCKDLGLTGECCPTADGKFLDCCKPRECQVHPLCAEGGLTGTCCPTNDNIYLDCCDLPMHYFEGFTGAIFQAKSPP